MVLPGPIPYTLNIPDGPHNPSNDQPDMQENTNSINALILEDHYTFSSPFAGWHEQVHMPNLGATPAADANMGTLYTLNGSQLHYTPDASGNQYQLTRAITASYAQFAVNAPYGTPTPGFTQDGGWTFLPGGLLFQYGTFSIGGPGLLSLTNIVQFPISFTGIPFVINITPVGPPGGSVSVIVSSAVAPTNTQFVYILSAFGPISIFWTAIGL